MKGLLVVFALVAAASAIPTPDVDLAKLEEVKEDVLPEKVESAETPVAAPVQSPVVHSNPLVTAPVFTHSPVLATAPLITHHPIVDTAVVDHYQGVVPGGVHVAPTYPYRLHHPYAYNTWYFNNYLKTYPYHHNYYGFSEHHYRTVPSYYV